MLVSKYENTQVAGSSFTRCARVVIENPKDGPRQVYFAEEQVINLIDGSSHTTPVGNLSRSIEGGLSESFDVLDPSTGEVLGSSTFGEAYALVHSAYMHCARKRDAV